jgi:hypothetical protein
METAAYPISTRAAPSFTPLRDRGDNYHICKVELRRNVFQFFSQKFLNQGCWRPVDTVQGYFQRSGSGGIKGGLFTPVGPAMTDGPPIGARVIRKRQARLSPRLHIAY